MWPRLRVVADVLHPIGHHLRAAADLLHDGDSVPAAHHTPHAVLALLSCELRRFPAHVRPGEAGPERDAGACDDVLGAGAGEYWGDEEEIGGVERVADQAGLYDVPARDAHEFACGKAVSRRVGEIRDDSRCEGAVPVFA